MYITWRQWESILSYMDDDTREAVHHELTPCTADEFLHAYLERDTEDTLLQTLKVEYYEAHEAIMRGETINVLEAVYRIKPEYRDTWSTDGTADRVTGSEILDLAAEWEKPVEDLLAQVELFT